MRLAVDLEGREITGVDADHGRPESDRTLQLVGIVRFDERVEAELARQAEQHPHLSVVEVAEQQQHGVGARLLRGAQVLLGREEALGEQGDAGRRAGGPQIVPVAAEELVHEHRDGGCAGAGVRGRELSGIGVRADVAERGRAPLDLGDRAEPGAGERVVKPHA